MEPKGYECLFQEPPIMSILKLLNPVHISGSYSLRVRYIIQLLSIIPLFYATESVVKFISVV
jgi:hypothetical protein